MSPAKDLLSRPRSPRKGRRGCPRRLALRPGGQTYRTILPWMAQETQYCSLRYILGTVYSAKTEASEISPGGGGGQYGPGTAGRGRHGNERIAADSTMLRMVNRLIALSLGVHREQLEHRIGLTWPRPFLLRPL